MTEPVFGLTAGAAKILHDMADKHRQRLPDAGRRTRRVSPNSTGGGGGTRACNPCTNGTGAMTVDLGSGFMASETYQSILFCENIDPIVYGDHDAGPPHEWTGTADPMTVDCNGDTVTFTSALKYFDHLPGNGTSTGIVVEWSDGTNTWKWVNRTAWQPGLRTELELIDGPAECPCAPFVDFPCLIPIPTPA